MLDLQQSLMVKPILIDHRPSVSMYYEFSRLPIRFGDPATAGVLFTRIEQKYRTYCWSRAYDIVRDKDAAYDVAQIAFISVYNALLHFTNTKMREMETRPWLYTIVRNAALNYIRLHRNQREFQVDDQNSWLYRIEADEYSNPEMVVLHMEDRKAFEEVLSLLPWSYQKVIVAHVLRKKSYEEIAEEEQSDVRTIRTRHHRATRSLAKIVMSQEISESELRRWLLGYTFNDEEKGSSREENKEVLAGEYIDIIESIMQGVV